MLTYLFTLVMFDNRTIHTDYVPTLLLNLDPNLFNHQTHVYVPTLSLNTRIIFDLGQERMFLFPNKYFKSMFVDTATECFGILKECSLSLDKYLPNSGFTLKPFHIEDPVLHHQIH